MSTRGQFNTKNPTIKRILKEASELANNPSPDLHAEPLEDNLFEWHFTLRGPPSPSSYANGIYHGRIILPPQYPLRPPSFRFLTPTGRFEVNREICLSISGHHEETWQPAWGIRTAMVAIRSFMDTDVQGQLGGLQCNDATRRSMAVESAGWKCVTCGRTNQQIMADREAAAKEREDAGAAKKEETVPEELRLAYREDLGGKDDGAGEAAAGQVQQGTHIPVAGGASPRDNNTRPDPAPAATAPPSQTASSSSIDVPNTTSPPYISPQPRTAPLPTRTTPLPPPQRPTPFHVDRGVPPWVDKAIAGLVAALVIMVLKKLFYV
ncbi:hypothetical protein LTR04_001548 [Oleoguttula sp. CCFEE 6159]|nr:hypothetical protein LTR04_001548 [Oleoguttula sp. CCFEE 6159]